MIPSIVPLWLLVVSATFGIAAVFATYRAPVRHASEFRLSRVALLLCGWLLILVPAGLYTLALPPTRFSEAVFLSLLLLPFVSGSLFSRNLRQQQSRSPLPPAA